MSECKVCIYGNYRKDALYAYISTEDSVIMLHITNNYDFLTFNLL